MSGTPSLRSAATRGSVIHWATWYDRLVALLTLGRAPALRRATIQLATLQPTDAVLEVGCGTGTIALAARPHAGTVIGIDPSAEMITRARHKARQTATEVDFQVGVIESLAFPDASFDVVLSSLMMHHLPDAVKRAGIAEIRRVLKPGGRLVIADMLRPAGGLSRLVPAVLLHSTLTTGVQDLTPLLNAAGFADLRSGPLPLRGTGFVTGVRA